MQAGEMDWWENPSADLLPVLRKAKILTPINDHTGNPYVEQFIHGRAEGPIKMAVKA